MAKDLIPPPSPAGKAELPGGVPNLIELPPEPPRSAAQPSQVPAYSPSEFRNRFGFLMGALAGVVVAAAMVAVVVAVQSGGNGADDFGLERNWSRWQPSDTDMAVGAEEIADQVGAKYLQNGKQLVEVKPIVQDLDVIVRPSTGANREIHGPAVIYQLDGLGPSMSILGGKPSPERLKVLHREALELSLYTFRYLPDVEMVAVMLPPPPPPKTTGTDPAASTAGTNGANGTSGASAADQCLDDATTGMNPCRSALFYRPGDLKQYLQVPLGVTVPGKTPTPETLDAAEAKAIDELTLSNKFLWVAQQDASGATRLVLDRP